MDHSEPHVQTNSSQLNSEVSAARRLLSATGNFLKDHKNEAVATLAAATLTLSLAACGTNASAEGPEPSTTTSQGTETPAPTETETTTPTPEATTGNPEDLSTPVTVGPFGNEYAPLHSTEVLTTTVPVEQLQAMDWPEFALQSVPDRMNYLFTSIEKAGGSRNVYFDVNANFVPDLVVAAWADANMYAFYADNPNECAKLSIADMMYTTDPNSGGVSEAAQETAETWKAACETRTDISSWGGSALLTDEVSIRQEQYMAGVNTPPNVSILGYDEYDDADVTGHRTKEAIELTIQRPNGQTVVAYAFGRDV